MKFSLFLGCNIPARVQQYERSARAVLAELGVEIADNPKFKCCGNPIRNTDQETFILMAARNLALAEQQGANMMVLCKCCFGALKNAACLLAENPLISANVNTFLSKENLTYTGKVKVKHFLSVLYHDVGMDAIKQKIRAPVEEIKIATHYGCHALRPSEVTQFDDPVAPVIFDELVRVTGAKSVDWPLKLECCGAPLLGVNDAISIAITKKKIASGIRAGANYLCAACPYCQMQFDHVQQMLSSDPDSKLHLASIIYPRLLEQAMGISDGGAKSKL